MYLEALLGERQVTDGNSLEAGDADGGHSKNQLANTRVVKFDDFRRF